MIESQCAPGVLAASHRVNNNTKTFRKNKASVDSNGRSHPVVCCGDTLQRVLLLTWYTQMMYVLLCAAGVHGRNRGRASGVQDERQGAVP